MPVQWVNRPNLDFRGFSGTITSGSVKPGDELVVAKSGKGSRVKAIVTADGDLTEAHAGKAITLVLEDEIDASRGDVFAARDSRPEVSNQFTANIIWMHEDELVAGRPYLLKIGAQTVQATVTGIRHKIDINTLDKTQGPRSWAQRDRFLQRLDQPADRFRPVQDDQGLRGLHPDRPLHQPDGGRGHDRVLADARHQRAPSRDGREQGRALHLKGHKPAILWFTGLSGAGKSTIANLVERNWRTLAPTPIRWTATTSARASTRTSASPTRIGSKTFAALARSPGCSSMPA